jgi:SHS2 domain-containing protein
MSFEYLDHEADVGIRAYGATLEEAFCEGARAMFNVMADIKSVEARRSLEVECSANSVTSLFVEWLNALLAQADIEGMLFSEFEAAISEKDGVYELKGMARGEDIDPQKHELHTEVKAATYAGLTYEKTEDGYVLQCIVDV